MNSLQIVTAVTVAALVGCAIQAIRARRLLASALWLACTSALAALLMYALGAAEVGVIELSVGAGLVTVLFVFAINIAGDEPIPVTSRVPRPVAWLVVLCSLGLLAWLTVPGAGGLLPAPGGGDFAKAVWDDRGPDVLLQVALIFSGVLGVLGVLADGTPSTRRTGGGDATAHASVPGVAEEEAR